MIQFESDFFQTINFDAKQIGDYIKSAKRDLFIAKSSDVSEVVFKFSYDAIIKLGVILIAKHGYKVRSVPGHHVKIIEKISLILDDSTIQVIGNKMRYSRNTDLYGGNFLISNKDTGEFLSFVGDVFARAEKFFNE